MARHKRKQKQDERICQNCDNCTYAGDGGYWCLEMSKLVMDDFELTDDYFCCGERCGRKETNKMTETTKETIKFARSWLKNAEKYGDPNAPTTGTMTALARAVMELADEVEKLESINMDHLEELDRQEWLLDNANEELAALKEKMRWRDENVEPAPRGERVLVYCIDYDASDEVHDTEMEHMYCPDGELAYPYTWWRPLDLPEEDAK